MNDQKINSVKSCMRNGSWFEMTLRLKKQEANSNLNTLEVLVNRKVEMDTFLWKYMQVLIGDREFEIIFILFHIMYSKF